MNDDTTTKQDTGPLPILDLDRIDSETNIDYDEMIKSEEFLLNEQEETESGKKFSGKQLLRTFMKINWHIVLLIVLLISVIIIIYSIRNWGEKIDLSELFPEGDTPDQEIEVEVLDNILPNLNSEGSIAASDDVTNIVLFGNGAFAEDYGTIDNVGNLIAEMTDANVYNCAVSNSHLAATNVTFSASSDAMDAFNFYWLTTLAAVGNEVPGEQALEDAPEQLPAEAQTVYDLLMSIDFSTIDVIGIMYDATDYLEGRPVFNAENHTDIQTYYGNLTAGLELLQNTYPHIRIIVMSPTYAYAVDSEGNYVESDIYVYNEFPLSTYSQMLEQSASNAGVSFVDNLYGTVNLYNANDYLIDNVKLNKDGKQKLAERFVYALQYYD